MAERLKSIPVIERVRQRQPEAASKNIVYAAVIELELIADILLFRQGLEDEIKVEDEDDNSSERAREEANTRIGRFLARCEEPVSSRWFQAFDGTSHYKRVLEVYNEARAGVSDQDIIRIGN